MKDAARQGGRGEEPHRYNVHAPFTKRLRRPIQSATVIVYHFSLSIIGGGIIDDTTRLRYRSGLGNGPTTL